MIVSSFFNQTTNFHQNYPNFYQYWLVQNPTGGYPLKAGYGPKINKSPSVSGFFYAYIHKATYMYGCDN